MIERQPLHRVRSRYPGEALLAFRRDPLAFLDRATASGAHLAMVRAPGRSIAIVGSPEAARELLVERETDLVRGRALVMTTFLLGGGLLTTSGAEHREARKHLAPAFSRDRLAALAERIERRADRLASDWLSRQRVDAEAEMRRLSLALAADVLFGEAEYDGAPVLAALDVALALFSRTFHPFAPALNRLPLPGTIRLRRARARLWRATDALVQRRRQRGKTSEPPDVLDLLLTWERAGGLSPADLRGHALNLLVAGHETTGAGLAFALHVLAANPEWQSRVGGDSDASRRAFLESMRIYPPAWVASREAARDTSLAGVFLPRRTVVLMSPWVLGRDPRLWPDPARFDPDRFCPAPSADRHRFAFVPFSAGRHGCLAERLAMMEGEIVLRHLLQRVRLRPAAPFPGLAARTTLRPAGPVWLHVSPR